MSGRRRETKTSEGNLHIRVVSGAETCSGLLTVDGKLPLESDHSRCSGLGPYCDKHRKRRSTRDRHLQMARKTGRELSMKSGARMIRTAVGYDIERKFLGLCLPRARERLPQK